VYADKVIREIDAVSGKTLFEVPGYEYPWGAHATPEGHRLAVDYQKRVVVEYDHQGKECWRHDLPGQPTHVERQPDGRTLLALPTPGMVIELDRQGKVVWQIDMAGDGPTCAQRLPNGNTLVCQIFKKQVVEINRKGEVVWRLPAGLVDSPHTAQQLDNGNVLVCDFGRFSGATEFDRAGKIVWTKRTLNNPAQAQRLPNGNTLISTEGSLAEYDPQGNIVRQFRVSRSRFFAY
jgi:hypothetical protein